MRKLIFIGVLFKVQISLAFGEGDPTQSCLNGKNCLSDTQCGENGICQFLGMAILGKPPFGHVNDYSKDQNLDPKPIQFLTFLSSSCK